MPYWLGRVVFIAHAGEGMHLTACDHPFHLQRSPLGSPSYEYGGLIGSVPGVAFVGGRRSH